MDNIGLAFESLSAFSRRPQALRNERWLMGLSIDLSFFFLLFPLAKEPWAKLYPIVHNASIIIEHRYMNKISTHTPARMQ